MVSHLYTGYAVSHGVLYIPNEPAVTFVFSAPLQVIELAAAGLVFYLLARSGEGPGSIGLGRHQLRTDLALVLPVWFLVDTIPQRIGPAIVHGSGLPTFELSTPFEPGSFVILGIMASLVAGILEETVVLGFLVRRLEQRGWSPILVVMVAVAIRVSYHLYYGPGVIPIVLWATASVLMYRRIRRLLPFIICHVMWDATIEIGHYSPTSAGLAGNLPDRDPGLYGEVVEMGSELGEQSGRTSREPHNAPLWR